MVKNVFTKIELLDLNKSLKKGKNVSAADGEIPLSGAENPGNGKGGAFSSFLRDGLDSLVGINNNDSYDGDYRNSEALSVAGATEKELQKEKIPDEILMRSREDEVLTDAQLELSEKNIGIGAGVSVAHIFSKEALFVDAGQCGSEYRDFIESARAELSIAEQIDSRVRLASAREAVAVAAGRSTEGIAVSGRQDEGIDLRIPLNGRALPTERINGEPADAPAADYPAAGMASSPDKGIFANDRPGYPLSPKLPEGSRTAGEALTPGNPLTLKDTVPQKDGGIVPVGEAIQKTVDNAVADNYSPEVENGSGKSPELSAANLIGVHVRLASVRGEAGAVVARFAERVAVSGRQGDGIDLRAPLNGRALPTERSSGEPVGVSVADYPAAGSAISPDKGIFPNDPPGEPLSAANLPKGSRAAGEALPSGNLLKYAVPEKGAKTYPAEEVMQRVVAHAVADSDSPEAENGGGKSPELSAAAPLEGRVRLVSAREAGAVAAGPAEKVNGGPVEAPAADYHADRTAPSRDRGIFANDRPGEPLSAKLPEGSRTAGEALPKDNPFNNARSQNVSELAFLQAKVDSPSINNAESSETISRSSLKVQKNRGIFPFEGTPGKAVGSDIVDANSNNIGRQFLSADISAPVAGHKLVEQVIREFPKGVLSGSNRVRINLYPESLGSVDMDIVVRENRVHVFIIAERADVVQALQGQQEQLRNALQSKGLQVNILDFQIRENPASMGDGSRGGDLWRHQNQDRGQKEEKDYEVPRLSGRLGALTGNIMHNSQMERTISIFV
ncbi:MAG: flagellar hook-length control protein FliK [Syntrophales bacterium]